jgi:hypothetical protein
MHGKNVIGADLRHAGLSGVGRNGRPQRKQRPGIETHVPIAGGVLRAICAGPDQQ